MEKLTNEQKNQLIAHMNRYEDNSWAQHSQWALATFNVRLTDDECSRLFIKSMF